MFNTIGVPTRDLPKTFNIDLFNKMKVIESGRWSIDDILENMVDTEETTTAASVGSGVAKPLGTSRPYDDKYLKLINKYEEYLKRTGKKDNHRSIHEFFQESSPGADEKLINGFSNYIEEFNV